MPNASQTFMQIADPQQEGPFREIPLSRGKVAIVDAADYEILARHKWCARKNRTGKAFYAVRNGPREGRRSCPIIQMHREILSAPEESEVDHRDGDGLNNRRRNLRLANHSQNQHNQKARANNTSGFKGVTFNKERSRWMAQIRLGEKNHYLGLFSTAEAASSAYIEAAKRLHGEFANW